MVLGVRASGDAALVYGGEVDEKHGYAACPSICLLGVHWIWVAAGPVGGVGALLLALSTIGGGCYG